MPRCLLLTAMVLGMISSALAADPPIVDLQAAAADVLSGDAAVAAAAVERLRTAGPEGLAALLETHRELLAGSAAAANPAADPRGLRLKLAIDAVGAQRDCCTSRLYWYTDLTAAVNAARREGKPILSLRLLGRLTDEFSCANSRYFRTSLYANQEISRYLREHFVLHWQSVRPVPRVTIDFGDGRRLERTLTGNSIHWVLDSEGRPFDALPGLYGPPAFLREVKLIEGAIQQMAQRDDASRKATFLLFHQQRLQAIHQAWQRDLADLNVTVPAQAAAPENAAGQPGAAKRVADAARAGRLAASKGIVEIPALRAMAFNATERFRLATTDDVWLKLGARHQADAVLDDASIALIRRENQAAASDAAAGEPGSVEATLAAMVHSFQSAMAVDTVRNEYELHRQLHEWFAAGTDRTLETLNERVYSELFLTPRSDPWLGLAAPDTYTGLVRGGRRE